MNYISLTLAIVTYLTCLTVFLWNYYCHACYHIDNHWLNNFEWFKRDKELHFRHHNNPNKNYGIATHFSDILFNTYQI